MKAPNALAKFWKRLTAREDVTQAKGSSTPMSSTPSPDSSTTIDVVLTENRRFPPSAEFAAQANMRDPNIWEQAAADPVAFWEKQADRITWFKRWDKAFEWDSEGVHAKWFVGGKLNASYNCVDRHLKTRQNKAAIIWEGEPGDTRVLTYRDLYREVNHTAAMLRRLGLKKGDRVAIYMPMVPELAIALLACARLGAPHTVIFAGFSAESLRDRIQDSQAKMLLTADGSWRAGKIIPLKDIADAAADQSPTIEKVVTLKRLGEDVQPVKWHEGRDVWWHKALEETTERIVEPEPMDSEDPLYILYTSGTTGKPKGQMHTTGGYLVGTSLTHEWIFDLKENDVWWCTADIGWVTGHSYIVYGPMSNGATCVMYEGGPGYPDKDRFWALVEKYAITIMYTAPTSIRTFMRWGDEYPNKHDLSSLRLLGTVGEPINPEAWMWYHTVIGHERCPIVDTWWQTETGSIMITPLPGLVATKPGSATRPFPGIIADIVDGDGKSVPANTGGYLVIKHPWPAMSRTIWGDHQRYINVYWGTYKDTYLTGDGARKDEDGYFWLMGRVDDVVNISGHRLGTMEVESALVSHPDVAEAAVIGIPHEIKGQAIVAFVTLRAGHQPSEAKAQELREHVAHAIGGLARPEKVYFTAELPKTRSAKIMRRLLRDIAEGRVIGDTTTLADPGVLQEIKKQYEGSEG
jgi:acetyl-CoA synthetase